MKNYTDYLIESILEESAKTDFIAKFGQETFNNFEKAKQRLVNKGHSVDFGRYLAKDKKEVDDLILSLYDKKDNKGNDIDAAKRRSLQNKQREVRGKYKFFGQIDNYLVYQPLDYISSMDLGINTDWCTTGRYGHYGHPEYTPREEDAKKHFEEYTSKGIKFYYFLNPSTFYGEYALVLFSEVMPYDEDIVFNFCSELTYVTYSNFEIYSAKNIQVWLNNEKFWEIWNIAEKKLKLELIYETETHKNIQLKNDCCEIYDDRLINYWYSHTDNHVIIPDNVKIISNYAFSDDCEEIIDITFPKGLISIEPAAFDYADFDKLKNIYYAGNNSEIIKQLAKYADVINPDTGEVLEIKQK